MTEIPHHLVGEWHPLKNVLTISQLSSGSGMKVWWLGKCGHEWESRFFSRVKGSGCPVCAGKIIIAGTNDLVTLKPEVASQWHPNKNSLSPTAVAVNSNLKVWWQCIEGHEWETSISNRTSKKSTQCPICINKVILPGFNDLATINPALAAEWHPTKNTIKPTNVGAGSYHKVWWHCTKGHEWEASIINRHKNNNGCRYCAGYYNRQTYIFPQHLIKEWDKDKNLLNIEQISPGSTKKVWWKCGLGHAWLAVVYSRTQGQKNCPFCAGIKVSSGFNDLATINPALAAEWHPTKNAHLSPSEVTVKSVKKVWWKGTSCSHEWEAVLYARAAGNGCPICSGRATLVGFNDFGSSHATYLNEWHPTKNLPLTQQEITLSSGRKIWWQCDKGHEWKATPNNRKSQNQGCPTCANSLYVSAAEKELADYIKTLGLGITTSNRTILGQNKEIDIFIPSKRIGIEFNGIYWHSEQQGKTRDYHYNKWLAAKQVGVQLIQIWEDDWQKNPGLIKNMLAHKLQVSKSPKVYARKTFISLLDTVVAKDFFTSYHIQGFATATHYVGLQDESQQLVALLAVRVEVGGVINIVRYATSGIVVGGFTKLLSHVEKWLIPVKIVTFADHTISDGALYLDNGFVADKEIRPDYMYVVKGQRKHKFGYRLKRFRNDPVLLWEEGLSESQLAALNKIPKIWDAGKTRYIKMLY